MLQQAALQQTGKASFIDGLTYDSKTNTSVTEQEKAYLYQNALDYAQANNLQLGDALTQTQIGALDKPMLWYVEQTVPDPTCTATGTATCPTITALMPQVYLPSDTSAMSAGGNITGTDVTLNFGKGAGGSILNTGSITASDTLTVNTDSLTNQANQVDIGQIWSSVKGGYIDTTGTTVQPGGFMSAANMDLNVQTLSQIGGALEKLNADGTVDQLGTQLILSQLQDQLGSAFSQVTVSDNLHTQFVQAGGLGAFGQILSMAVEIVASMYLGPIAGALVGSIAGQMITTGSVDWGSVGQAVAVSALTAGIDYGLNLNEASGFTDLGSGVVSADPAVTLSNLGAMAGNVAARSIVSAGVSTLVYGGSFGQALKDDLVTNFSAVGANAIGDEFTASSGLFSSGSPLDIAAHAALGCASSAALGTGCAGGAIGGAVSAGLNPLINSSGVISPGVLAGIETLVGGGVAGALGFNVQGATTAAQNETLNNFCEHNSCGKWVTTFVDNVSNAVNAGADVPAMESAAGTDVLAGIGNTALNAATFSLPGMPDFVPYFQYNNQALGALGELYGTFGLTTLASSALAESVGTNNTLKFSQTTASPWFSGEGNLAGFTISDVASQLRTGTLAASDLPVQTITMGGDTLIVNTRSSLALTQAGVPQNQWTFIDMTGDAATEAAIAARLDKNGLTNSGTSTLRITGSGQNTSTYVGSGSIPRPGAKQ